MIPYLVTNAEEQRKKFLSLKTPREIADLLEVDYGRLVYHLYKVPDDEKYIEFSIPKRSGGARQILAPVTALKILQKKLGQVLNEVYRIKPSAYGFVLGRNVVGNARRHRRRKYVFNIDLEDFFPSINFGRVRGLFIGKPYGLPDNVATVLAQICCHRNILPQGAPTSPIVSNMICASMDSDLQELARRNKCTYTRYADDITFSTSMKAFPAAIAIPVSITEAKVGGDLEAIVINHGFDLNRNKIRMQPWFRRQQVTGLTVNQFPNVRRKFVKQIRAMLHAWWRFGIANAEIEFFSKYDKKHRNPELEFPAFRQDVRGKIEYLGMVRGRKNPIYQRFLAEFHRLNSRDAGIPHLSVSNLSELEMPALYTEGKTDVSILKSAFKKLYSGHDMPFRIQSSDPLGRSFTAGGSGGANSLRNLLNTRMDNERNIAIGLFDRDREGIVQYTKKLAKDFVEDSEADWRVSKDRKSGALMLPVPPGKEQYASFKNLSIEFYFSDQALSTQTQDGLGLDLEYPKLDFRGIELPKEAQAQIAETRSIKAGKGKKIFAESIVPDLEPNEFESFRVLFERIFELIQVLQEGADE